MADFTLTQEQYEALIALARKGTSTLAEVVALDRWLKLIEKDNGIERDFLWVQWQEAGEGLPATVNFPENYPPELRQSIELVTRKIAKVDVEAVLEEYANNPVNVVVTRDPAARAGWTSLDDFFIT